MTGRVQVVPMSLDTKCWDNVIVVNTTSRAAESWERQLSPFFLGPCRLYGGRSALLMENAWQFSKLYPEHATDGEPTDAYWTWAESGWSDAAPRRYPMGRGRKPLCSLWDGKKLTYVQARKKVYAPLYAEVVKKTEAFKRLCDLYAEGKHLVLRDFDGYDHELLGRTLREVMEDPDKKMGHAFVLKALITNDPSMKEWGP